MDMRPCVFVIDDSDKEPSARRDGGYHEYLTQNGMDDTVKSFDIVDTDPSTGQNTVVGTMTSYCFDFTEDHCQYLNMNARDLGEAYDSDHGNAPPRAHNVGTDSFSQFRNSKSRDLVRSLQSSMSAEVGGVGTATLAFPGAPVRRRLEEEGGTSSAGVEEQKNRLLQDDEGISSDIGLSIDVSTLDDGFAGLRTAGCITLGPTKAMDVATIGASLFFLSAMVLS